MLFQEQLPSGYRPPAEPRCSTALGWRVLDAIITAGDALIVGAELARERGRRDDAAMVTAAASGVLHLISFGEGTRWAGECDAARRRRDAALDEDDERFARGRGFFCASSPSVAAESICVREIAECEQQRGEAIAGVPDLGACARSATAWCVGELCTTTSARCEARRDANGMSGPCEERR